MFSATHLYFNIRSVSGINTHAQTIYSNKDSVERTDCSAIVYKSEKWEKRYWFVNVLLFLAADFCSWRYVNAEERISCRTVSISWWLAWRSGVDASCLIFFFSFWSDPKHQVGSAIRAEDRLEACRKAEIVSWWTHHDAVFFSAGYPEERLYIYTAKLWGSETCFTQNNLIINKAWRNDSKSFCTGNMFLQASHIRSSASVILHLICRGH